MRIFRIADCLLVLVAAMLPNAHVMVVGEDKDFRSFESYSAGSFACESELLDSREAPSDGDEGGALYSLNYDCDSLFAPTAWQKKRPKISPTDADYDLIIVGGGIGGAYMASRLAQEFKKKGQDVPKIALFERTEVLGGRLQSGFGTGSLGLGVSPRQTDVRGAPLQEYGGMRIDPFRFPLIYTEVIEEGKRIYGEDACQGLDKCDPRKQSNCCDVMLRRMDVGHVRFATASPDMGILSDSKVTERSETYEVLEDETVSHTYSLEDIANGIGTPFDRCMQIVVAIDSYYDVQGEDSSRLLGEAIDELCLQCEDSGIEGMCNLCQAFPDPTAAVISCSGIDLSRNRDLGGAIRFFNTALNIDNQTYLYLLRFGFQRFVMSLLRSSGELGIAPQYGRTLVELSLQDGSNAEFLSASQVNALSSPVQYPTVPAEGVIAAKFADGSVATGRSVFLNVLPFDLPQIKGLDAWSGPARDAWRPTILVKVVMGWNDKEKAPAAVFDMTPCVPGPCERLILDSNRDGWNTRQVWLWDSTTIMFYVLTADLYGDVPAVNMRNIARDEGMDALVAQLMDEVREATGVDIEDPDWARLKIWPAGSTAGFNSTAIEQLYNASESQLGGHISRPMGYDIPVYYGNSEAAPTGSNHGWVEGALEMVENNLQSIATYLGLEGEIEKRPYTRTNRDEDTSNDPSSGHGYHIGGVFQIIVIACSLYMYV